MKKMNSKWLMQLFCVLCMMVSLLPESASAASAYCPYCNATRSYTYEYVARDSDTHMERMWCSSCGLDMNEGVIYSDHSYMDYGDYLKCTDCGYKLEGTVSCSHTSTRTSWDGCEWSEYCRSCGELVDYGISHGTYEYSAWEYYSSAKHRRLYACSDCGEGSYSYGSHSTTTSYAQSNASQHKVSNYCSVCSTTVSSSYESHSFSYGSWSNYSATQHRRLATCSSCGYSTYEYANHPLSYGTWSSVSGTQHRRTVSCSTCNYSTYEYGDHPLTYGAWTNYSSTQHRRTATCSTCSYSTYEYGDHPLSYGAWSSASSTQHKRTVSCTTCSYSTDAYGDHADGNVDGSCDTCSYGMSVFSVTVPASLKMVVSEKGEVYAAENASIVNRSTGSVVASAVTVEAKNGWKLVPYSNNMAGEKVDSKKIGFALNGAATKTSGSKEELSLSAGKWTISKGGELPLQYDAVVSAVSAPVNGQVLNLTFVFAWA